MEFWNGILSGLVEMFSDGLYWSPEWLKIVDMKIERSTTTGKVSMVITVTYMKGF